MASNHHHLLEFNLNIFELLGLTGGQPANGAPPSPTPNTPQAQQPAQTAQPNALPQAPPADYATFIKNLADAANANINARGLNRGLWGMLSGADRKAAQANVVAGAPAEWNALRAGGNTAEAGELSNIQDISVLNNRRARAGLPPLDPNNLTAGAAPQIPRGSVIDPGMISGAARSLPAPAVSAGPLAPPQGAPSGQDPNAFMSQLGRLPPISLPSQLGVFGQAPVAQSAAPIPGARMTAPPSMNPVQAQRAGLAQMIQDMVGVPKYAGVVSELMKLNQTGLPTDTGATITDDGLARDSLSGDPINEDVQSRFANRAGAVSEAQGVAARKTERLKAGLERDTNSQRIADQYTADVDKLGVENAYRPPTLMRAPDGSVVGVSPTQMAQAQSTGALNGYRPLTEEDTKALGAMGEGYAKDQASLPDLRNAQNTLHTMLDQATAFPPGTFGEFRADVGRLLTGLGADPDQVAKIVGNPAGADTIMKNTLTLAMSRLKSSFGQAREAGFIVEKTMQANPNISTQPEAYSLMLNSMNQETQRQVDYVTGQQAYRQQRGTTEGYTEQFDKAHPVTEYANRAMTDTYGAPPGSKYLGRNKGRPIFQFPDGSKHKVEAH